MIWTQRQPQLLLKHHSYMFSLVDYIFLFHFPILAGISQIQPLPSSNPASVLREDPPHESPRDNCIVQTTEWSDCSATCGMAVSSRITNDNQRCQLERQTRICMVRPCDSQQEREIKVGRLLLRDQCSQQAACQVSL